jgi:diguanylate cyclase (GGDEF)-like protein
LSLKTRLFAFFVAIVVVPLAVASFLARGLTVRELENRTGDQLRSAGVAAASAYQLRVANAPSQIRLVVSDPQFLQLLAEDKRGELQALLRQRLSELPTERANRIDYLIVVAPDGAVLASSFLDAGYLPGVEVPSAADIVGDAPSSKAVTRDEVPIQSATGDDVAARVLGGYYLDNQFIEAISRTTVDGTFFVDERAVASTSDTVREAQGPVILPLSGDQADNSFFQAEVADDPVYASPVRVLEDVELSDVALVVTASQAPVVGLAQRMTFAVALLLILAAVGAVILGYLLTRGITRPLSELAAGADAIAGGNYQQHIEVRSRDEVGKLAAAFNAMADSLELHVSQLNESREELKRALTRFGETLRSTHDLEQLLNVIVETSLDHLGAARGLLMLLTPDRDRLVVRVQRGIDYADFDLEAGQGLAGHVVATGAPLRIPNGHEELTPAPQEPKFQTALMVPIFAEERCVGVLCLFDKEEGLNFTEVDMASLLSLADQAGVAIENVFLHDQARTHAIVDTVVGTWNRRYFEQRLQQELERHKRFAREFSLLLIDIDDFKHVNDNYGHQRGDAVLIELVGRVKQVIREIDVFARFGGEEFVLVLPETEIDGGIRTAEKIRDVIKERTFEGEPPVNITVSVGVASYPDHGSDRDALLAASDKAMYQAKAEGKDRTVKYEPAQPGQ